MGQHKYNQTAIAAKNGELPPKQKKISKRELDRIIYKKCQDKLTEYYAAKVKGFEKDCLVEYATKSLM